ncbi:hypothetical protein BCR24_07665 [Enterococcus ureilyticus]|uniref:FtsK domain-containing protein n=1 Tax=Enterococcus ureilyticus TaxID=1131292 RepID=A0A1E5H931_9ENTE|nr:hypothetical protein [Enterococcus ureilyticus]MBM7687501.1 hypothetical protein [Enterococcus ureilyticus]OEG21335.1 hypothetical protein BCR24_07665 [Enterococcus ureilyticus]
MKHYVVNKNERDAKQRLTDRISFHEILLITLTTVSWFIHTRSKVLMLEQFYSIDTVKKISTVALVVFSISSVSLLSYNSYLFLKTLLLKKNKNPMYWFKEYEVQIRLNEAFKRMKMTNKIQGVNGFEIPCTRVNWLKDSKNYQIFIEVLPATAGKEDEIIPALNAALKGSLERFAVSDMLISESGNWVEYLFEDVLINKNWTVRNIKELKPSKHYVYKLMNNLTIDIRQHSHMLLTGKTSSRKTTVIFSLMAQFFLDSCEIIIVDVKNEFSMFSSFLEEDHIVTNADKALDLLERSVQTMNARQSLVTEYATTYDKAGTTAGDLNMRPLVIICDEVAALMQTFESKKDKDKFMSLLSQLVLKGRSALVSVIFAMQRPDSNSTITGAIRDQCSFRLLLGSSTKEARQMVLGESFENVKSNVKKGEGYYLLDGCTNQPQKFHVMDIYTYQIARPSLMKKAYEIGKSEDAYTNYDFDIF